MAAVSLFWDTNMAAMTSCENNYRVEIRLLQIFTSSRNPRYKHQRNSKRRDLICSHSSFSRVKWTCYFHCEVIMFSRENSLCISLVFRWWIYLRFLISSRPLSLDESDLFGNTILICILNFRVIRELEAQLEYEREKREKLEAQMDKLRAQIHTLTLQLEDERSGRLTAVRFSLTNYSRNNSILIIIIIIIIIIEREREIWSRGYGKRQMTGSSCEFLKTENNLIKTVQNNYVSWK